MKKFMSEEKCKVAKRARGMTSLFTQRVKKMHNGFSQRNSHGRFLQTSRKLEALVKYRAQALKSGGRTADQRRKNGIRNIGRAYRAPKNVPFASAIIYVGTDIDCAPVKEGSARAGKTGSRSCSFLTINRGVSRAGRNDWSGALLASDPITARVPDKLWDAMPRRPKIQF